MQDRRDRIRLLKEALSERILVLDGAMGTEFQNAGLSAEDFGGAALDGCNENLVLTRPDVVSGVHEAYCLGRRGHHRNQYLRGPWTSCSRSTDCRTVSRSSTPRPGDSLAKPPIGIRAGRRPRFVAGAMGPSTKSITVTGGIQFDQLIESYRQQALALAEYADLLILETCQDTRNIKASMIGIERALGEFGLRLPVIVSGTIEPMGTMLAGQTAESLVVSLEHLDLLGIGLNCATGPQYMTDHMRTIHETARPHVSCYPNAGLPDEDGNYRESPRMLASVLERFARNGWLNIVGGCCGTTPDHIRVISQMVSGYAPRRHVPHRRTRFSGIDLVEASDDNRPLLVGERTNVVGSRRFKRLISAEDFERASEIGRAQVKGGAQIIDVNLENPDRDELSDIEAFYSLLIRKVKVPIMIDTTDPAAVERALTYCQGKAIVNSINFEEGERRFNEVVPLLRRYGAAVVVGAIDEDPEQAQAITRERKLAISERAREVLTGRWCLAEEDIIFDPLVFPCGTGDTNYVGSAVETIEGPENDQGPACRLPRRCWGSAMSALDCLPPLGRWSTRYFFIMRRVLGWIWRS